MSSDEKEQKTDAMASKSDSKEELDVKSANSWEAVDLGDDDRKKKFLRLMGATKKEHHGRFVIGDKEPEHPHNRDKLQTDEVNKKLEEQFAFSNEHKITRWSHTGLGFDKPAPRFQAELPTEGGDKATSAPTCDTKEQSQQKSEAAKGSANSSTDSANTSDRKRESTDKPEAQNGSVPKKPKMMMNFVKASD